MKKNTLARTMRLAQLAMLIAIQAILTFTPLGFIMIPPISITIMHIPVIIGAVTMGPLFGGILGASFGVMSMLKATFAAASPADIIFSPFISGTPVQSLILCVVPRILLGVIAAWLFIGLKKLIKNETASIGLSRWNCHAVPQRDGARPDVVSLRFSSAQGSICHDDVAQLPFGDRDGCRRRHGGMQAAAGLSP